MHESDSSSWAIPSLSLVGLCLCATAFAFSYSEIGAVTHSYIELVLCLPGLALYRATLRRDGRPLRSRTLMFHLEDFAQGAPFATIPIGWFLNVCALGALVWVVIAFHGGVPNAVDERYVLDSHGHVLKELSRAQYLKDQGFMLRCTLLFYLPAYWVAFTYWCLGRGRPNHSYRPVTD